jgi:hypothetical protein
MAQKALAAVKNFVSKIPFKAPWEVGRLHDRRLRKISGVDAYWQTYAGYWCGFIS